MVVGQTFGNELSYLYQFACHELVDGRALNPPARQGLRDTPPVMYY